MPFYVDATTTASSIFSATGSSRDPSHGSTLSVRSIKLDDLYDGARKTFVKMDIEGAEYRALASSRSFLTSQTTTFLVEVHPWGNSERRRYPIHVATTHVTLWIQNEKGSTTLFLWITLCIF